MRSNYRITPDTMAIFPLYDVMYQSSILEYHQTVTSEEKPFDIIKENCLHHGSSYQGRKASVQHHLDFRQKNPPRSHTTHPKNLFFSYTICYIV
ncbi:competence protein ComK [Gracilibacillus sp. JCM 18860]|uniref:competence protein ComK n=1 Tax=Gracilibacillus sp. JCM 18860 TaxID=1306159 RepID=UPI0006D02BA9